jgi:hypothetical protein
LQSCTVDTDCPQIEGHSCLPKRCISGVCQVTPLDGDNDGFINEACGGLADDCDDRNATIHRYGWEYCDCIDNNCNKTIDDECNYSTRLIYPGMDKVVSKGGVFGCYADRPFKPIPWPLINSQDITAPAMNTIFMRRAQENGPNAVIWYYGRDGKRYLFSFLGAFESWFGKGADQCCHTRTITDLVFNLIPLGEMAGGKVCYRPGSRILKMEWGGKVGDWLLLVSRGCKLRKVSEPVAEQIYGSKWQDYVETIPFAHYFNYFGAPEVKSASDYDLNAELSSALTIDDNQNL